MEFLTKLAGKIGNNLVQSGVIKEEDAEIYIYGINQILVSVLNVSSALIIGLIFGVFYEAAVFMVAYIPLRSFAGGYHAKTPLRCYVFSVMMLIIVSISMKYIYIMEWICGMILLVAALIIIVLSPVEDANKPLDIVELSVYKKRTIFILSVELIGSSVLKMMGLNGVYIVVIYSLTVLSIMLIVGKIKNCLNTSKKWR